MKNKKYIILKEYFLTLILTLITTLFILGNIFSITDIRGISMEPSFYNDEKIFNYKLAYKKKEPKYGDVIILNKFYEEKGWIKNTIIQGKDIVENIYGRITGNMSEKYIIKRVIGVQGDTIDIIDNYVYINGKKQEEIYIKGKTLQGSGISYPIKIPEKKVFVLGDNRENSLDSRILGLIDHEQIVGKVVFRLWPIEKIGKINK